jgi:hypothetical protein
MIREVLLWRIPWKHGAARQIDGLHHLFLRVDASTCLLLPLQFQTKLFFRVSLPLVLQSFLFFQFLTLFFLSINNIKESSAAAARQIAEKPRTRQRIFGLGSCRSLLLRRGRRHIAAVASVVGIIQRIIDN